MYKGLQRTCTAIVLLIKPFVLWRSRCRCRRGLLKVPIRACLHGGGGPQVGEVTRLGGVTRLSI